MYYFSLSSSELLLLSLDKDEKLTWEKQGIFIIIICLYLKFQRVQWEQKISSGTGCQELQVDTDVLI